MGFWQQPERKGLVERRLTTRRALEVPSHCQRGFRNTEQKRRPRQGQAVALLRRGAEFGTEGGHRAKETLGRKRRAGAGGVGGGRPMDGSPLTSSRQRRNTC